MRSIHEEFLAHVRIVLANLDDFELDEGENGNRRESQGFFTSYQEIDSSGITQFCNTFGNMQRKVLALATIILGEQILTKVKSSFVFALA